jgi:hypothetical protein
MFSRAVVRASMIVRLFVSDGGSPFFRVMAMTVVMVFVTFVGALCDMVVLFFGRRCFGQIWSVVLSLVIRHSDLGNIALFTHNSDLRSSRLNFVNTARHG